MPPGAPAPRGFTLVELMVAVAIVVVLAARGLPLLSEFVGNTRLREGANLVTAAALQARSEAIKSNTPVSLTISGGFIRVIRNDSPTPVTVRSHALPAQLAIDDFTATFDTAGRLTPMLDAVPVAIVPATGTGTCSDSLRCPTVSLSAGGAVSLCAQKGTCP